MSVNLHREPIAWVNDHRMSGKRFTFVEGSSDEWFWKKFINKDEFSVQQVDGWVNVINCIKEFNNNDLSSSCFGIVDSDFEKLYPEKNIIEPNIFITDCHDVELMMYSNEASFTSAILSIDKKNKLTVPPDAILKSVLCISDKIGYLKLTSRINKYNLVFKHENSDHEIELPKYENLIDKNGNYEGDTKLVTNLRNYSNNHKRNKEPLPNVTTLIEKLTIIQKNKYDSYQLSNGHDISYIMPYILRRKYGLSGNYINKDTVEISLFSAYDFTELRETLIFKSILSWATSNSLTVFNMS